MPTGNDLSAIFQRILRQIAIGPELINPVRAGGFRERADFIVRKGSRAVRILKAAKPVPY